MATNKPEVKRYDCTSEDSYHCHGCFTMKEQMRGDYVLYEYYEALQAKYEQLVSYTKNGIECFANPCSDHSGINTPPFSEFQERYGQLCLMCVVDERDALLVAAKQQPDVTQLVEALEKVRDAIGSLPQDALGNVPDTQQRQGWHIRDELINEISSALAAYRKGAES